MGSRRFPVVPHSSIHYPERPRRAKHVRNSLHWRHRPRARLVKNGTAFLETLLKQFLHFLPMSVHPPSERQFSADEGRTLLYGEIQPGGGNYNMPTYVQHVDLEETEPKLGNFMVSTSRTAWQRFNGHGRKRVGFFQSLKAVALSSCTFIIVPTFSGTHSGP